MNNTHKLLLAFIEASGYEVEEVATQASIDLRRKVLSLGAAFDPPLDYDYKVTKRCQRCKGSGVIEGGKVARDCPDCFKPSLDTGQKLYDRLYQNVDTRKCNRCGFGPASPSMSYCNDLNCGGTVK